MDNIVVRGITSNKATITAEESDKPFDEAVAKGDAYFIIKWMRQHVPPITWRHMLKALNTTQDRARQSTQEYFSEAFRRGFDPETDIMGFNDYGERYDDDDD